MSSSVTEYFRQREWIEAHFRRLNHDVAHYNHDIPAQVNEARFISTLKDIDKFNSFVGIGYGLVMAAALMRKFGIAEAVPVYGLFGWLGVKVNKYRHHDEMYAGLLRVVTKDPEQPI